MKTKEEILDGYSKEVGLINFKNAVKHVWLKQWSCTALIRLVEKAMEEYRNQPLPEQESKSADLEKFAQILGKCCLDNKVNLTSNERHTVYDAFKEYAQSHQVEMPSDGNLARNLHNWSDTHLDGDITLKDCYELINYFETLRKSGTLTLIR